MQTILTTQFQFQTKKQSRAHHVALRLDLVTLSLRNFFLHVRFHPASRAFRYINRGNFLDSGISGRQINAQL